MNINVDEILNRLESFYWIEPSTQEGDYLTYTLTQAQFQTVQKLLCASDAFLGPDLEDSISYLLQSEDGLDEDIVCGHYMIHDRDSGMKILSIWKEQYGLFLEHSVLDGDGYQIFGVLLPKSQVGSHAHKIVDLVRCGMTQEQYYKWNCYYASGEAYEEKAVFNNQHMVPLGWEPILTLEEIRELMATSSR